MSEVSVLFLMMDGSSRDVMYYRKTNSYVLSFTDTETRHREYINSGKPTGCIVKVIIFLMLPKNGSWIVLNVRMNGIRVVHHLILSAVGNHLGFRRMTMKGF